MRLPAGLETIGDYCFHGSGLESVEFPGSLRSVGTSAFYKCERLRSAYLNEGLQELGAPQSPGDGKNRG